MSLCWPPAIQPSLIMRKPTRWSLSRSKRKSTAYSANLSRINRTVQVEPPRLWLCPHPSTPSRREWEAQQAEVLHHMQFQPIQI
jgi:hypothetical protein